MIGKTISKTTSIKSNRHCEHSEAISIDVAKRNEIASSFLLAKTDFMTVTASTFHLSNTPFLPFGEMPEGQRGFKPFIK